MRSTRARAAIARGRVAELVVAEYLVARGFRVVGRNVRVGPLELDVLGLRGGLLVVVEVRTRGGGSIEGPFQSITAAKRARLAQAVDRLWRERLASMRSIERVRIDAAAVTFDRGQTHVEYIDGAISG